MYRGRLAWAFPDFRESCLESCGGRAKANILTKVAASLWKTSSRIETWDRDIAYTQKWVLVEIIQSLGVTEGAVSRVKGHTGRPLRPTHTHTQQRIWSTKTWRTSRQWSTTWPRHQSNVPGSKTTKIKKTNLLTCTAKLV